MGKRLPEIKQREDGRYEIKVTVGRNKRRSVYGKTEAEVRKKARQLLEEAAKFNLSNISKLTVRTYMTNWLLTVKKPDLKPGSYDRVEQSVNYQILPYIGDIQISALNANDIQNISGSTKHSFFMIIVPSAIYAKFRNSGSFKSYTP